MARDPYSFRTLDKDLRRMTLAEHATLHSTRPVLRLGIALIFMAAAGYGASAVFVGQPTFGILAATVAVAAYLALSIGANDVSNALSPAVGAGAIGMTAGLCLVASMEVLGAVIAGQAVTRTLTQGLVGDALGQGEATARMMLAALMAAGGFITLATWLDAPVSTTHSVVGAIAGASLASFGVQAVNWPALGLIAVGWIASPLISGTLAALLLAALRRLVMQRPDRVAAARIWLPAMVALAGAMLGAVGALAWHDLQPGRIVTIALVAAGRGHLCQAEA